MKKNATKIIVLIIGLFCFSKESISQSSSATNIVGTPNEPNTPGVDFLGWDSTVTIPLEIRTDDIAVPQPINFYTGGNFYTSGAPQMTIDPYGNVGIGTSGPVSLLNVSSNFFSPTDALGTFSVLFPTGSYGSPARRNVV